MDERLSLNLTELKQQCLELDSNEFEFYWEMWGVMWTPWFIEVNNKPLSFTANDVSMEDLDRLIKSGDIELVKIYDRSEMKGEFERKRYRIIK